ncbi:MAG: hypothetical protein AB7W47_05960 [Calditrichaceae bacterium]
MNRFILIATGYSSWTAGNLILFGFSRSWAETRDYFGLPVIPDPKVGAIGP